MRCVVTLFLSTFLMGLFSGCPDTKDNDEFAENKVVVSSELQSEQGEDSVQNDHLTIRAQENDLGTIYEYDIAEGHVELTNNAAELIIIDRIISSCGCGVVKLSQREISPGQTLVLHYTINTARRNGQFTSYFDVLFDVGDKAVNQSVRFSSTVNIITKGKVIANPAFIKRDGIDFSTQFSEKIVLSSLDAEALPSIIDIQHPEWLEISYDEGRVNDVVLEAKGQIPSMSGPLEGKIVVILDSERYPCLEIPLFLQVKGLVSFETTPVVRIVKEFNIPVSIDVLAKFTSKGIIESFSLESKDIKEKSVDFEMIDDKSVVFKVAFPSISKNEKNQAVFRSTLVINANVENNRHSARLPIVFIVPR